MAARDPRGQGPVGPPGPGEGGGWREQVTVASGLNVFAGAWLIIAPFVLNYDWPTRYGTTSCSAPRSGWSGWHG